MKEIIKKYLDAHGAFGRPGQYSKKANMYDDLIGRSVAQIWALMEEQGHSGGSWASTISALNDVNDLVHNPKRNKEYEIFS